MKAKELLSLSLTKMTTTLEITLPTYFAAYIRGTGVLKLYKNINNNIIPFIIPSNIRFHFSENIVKRSVSIKNIINNTFTNYEAYVLGQIGIFENIRIILYMFDDIFVHKFLYSSTTTNIFSIWNFEADIIVAKVISIIENSNTATLISHSSIPPYVIELIKQDAIKKEEFCPILFDKITIDNSVVTSCFHIFSKVGITEWLRTSSQCPTCRQNCMICS